jgi:hypothetical protein
MPRTKQARNRLGIYYDVNPFGELRLPPRPNLPQEEALVRAIGRALDRCVAVFDAHGRGCDCDFCEDTLHLKYNLEVAGSYLSGELMPLGSRLARA